MAAFRDEDTERLDFRLLQASPVALYFKRSVLDADLKWLAGERYIVDRVDASSWKSRADAIASIAAQLKFPDYFGGNLSALTDCLRDLEIPEAGGRCFVFERFDAAMRAVGESAWSILDVFACQSRELLLFGGRVIVAVQSDDPRLELKPVGALAPWWNPREWMNKDRGL